EARGHGTLLGRPVLELDQREDRGHEREPDRGAPDPAGHAPGLRPPSERGDQHPRERKRDHEPSAQGDAHPRSSETSSTSIGTRRRYIATIRPRPTTTSQAATTITTSAKTCPSPLPHM